MTLTLVDLVVLGALVLAVAALSAGVAFTAATNRELRNSAALWQAATYAAAGDVLGEVRITGSVSLADGSCRMVRGETIGQVVAALRPVREEVADPWKQGTGST